jgi:hypothetical protein
MATTTEPTLRIGNAAPLTLLAFMPGEAARVVVRMKAGGGNRTPINRCSLNIWVGVILIFSFPH